MMNKNRNKVEEVIKTKYYIVSSESNLPNFGMPVVYLRTTDRNLA